MDILGAREMASPWMRGVHLSWGFRAECEDFFISFGSGTYPWGFELSLAIQDDAETDIVCHRRGETLRGLIPSNLVFEALIHPLFKTYRRSSSYQVRRRALRRAAHLGGYPGLRGPSAIILAPSFEVDAD